MSPRDGDTKIEDGLSWIYRDPPGGWEVEPVIPPLREGEERDDHLRIDLDTPIGEDE